MPHSTAPARPGRLRRAQLAERGFQPPQSLRYVRQRRRAWRGKRRTLLLGAVTVEHAGRCPEAERGRVVVMVMAPEYRDSEPLKQLVL